MTNPSETSDNNSHRKSADISMLWLLSNDPAVRHKLDRRLLHDSRLGLQNGSELHLALRELAESKKNISIGDIALPDGFIRPRIALPIGFAPDYFTFSDFDFCSIRLRDALCQPPEVVQYTPLDLVRGSESAYHQDYKFFRVLSCQAALDLNNSLCSINEYPNRFTGEPVKFVISTRRMSFIDGFIPRAEIF